MEINPLAKFIILFSGKSLPEEVVNEVEVFYKRQDFSSQMPGMKDFLVMNNDDGEKQQVQKHLLLSNLKEAYQLLKEEQPDIQVGFSTFASLRPKECVLAGASGTHSVCVCPIHENFKLMLSG